VQLSGRRELPPAAWAAQLRPLILRCSFPPEGTRVDCAVSGGQDSLALLVLAVAAGCDAVAWHVDHGLREGSAAEAEVVRAAAGALGAGFESRSVTVVGGPNLEARARAARRAVLPAGVATGHTADDQAETVLLNLLRGAGVSGLAGIRRGPRHPLLDIRRTETAQVVAAAGLTPVVDPTNADPAFRRNRVRHELLPLCAEIAARDVVALVARQAELLADDADALDAAASGLDPTDVSALRAAPTALARRAVRRWLAGGPERYAPSAAAVERVLQVADGARRACEVEGGRRVRRAAGRLYLEQAPAADGPPPTPN
jgi:tRNA(Ile)-lysidine synthase